MGGYDDTEFLSRTGRFRRQADHLIEQSERDPAALRLALTDAAARRLILVRQSRSTRVDDEALEAEVEALNGLVKRLRDALNAGA